MESQKLFFYCVAIVAFTYSVAGNPITENPAPEKPTVYGPVIHTVEAGVEKITTLVQTLEEITVSLIKIVNIVGGIIPGLYSNGLGHPTRFPNLEKVMELQQRDPLP